MTDQPPVDMAGLLANLVQQQTELLKAHSESIRLQRLLVDRLLGASSIADGAGASQPEPPVQQVMTSASLTPATPPPAQLSVAPAATEPVHTAATGPAENLPVEHVSGPRPAPATESASSSASVRGGVEENAAYAPRYYRARPTPAPSPIQPQDLELMRRLHEMGDASGLILNFGLHKGDTLAQVAMHDPDYVRQLVNRAQRPEVRAAAGRLVEAIDAAAEHKKRTSRSNSRRSRASS
jgi:hypothetical protein